jgi:deoxycytidylate deaminase
MAWMLRRLAYAISTNSTCTAITTTAILTRLSEVIAIESNNQIEKNADQY